MAEQRLDLAKLEDLVKALEEGGHRWIEHKVPAGEFDGTFCSGCGATRRMTLLPVSWSPRSEDGIYSFEPSGATPALFLASCLQCRGWVTLLVHRGPAGPEVVALRSTYGGLATPHTPAAVAYYLDQAQRCDAVGALSASIAMYRVALEQLLYEQGYESGTLAKKIQELLGTASPPPWRDDLDPEFLRAIKDLGNAAIHPNDGDIAKQRAFESNLVGEVRALFEELLDLAYEQQHRRAERLARLKEAVGSFET